MKTLPIKSQKHTEFIDITDKVQDVVKDLGVKQAILTIYVPHTTAGITINENADPDVVADIENTLEKVVPWNDDYTHREGNAAGHVKASLTGSSVQVGIENGKVQLGTWQGIYFCEFDGPRSRQVWVFVTKQE